MPRCRQLFLPYRSNFLPFLLSGAHLDSSGLANSSDGSKGVNEEQSPSVSRSSSTQSLNTDGQPEQHGSTMALAEDPASDLNGGAGNNASGTSPPVVRRKAPNAPSLIESEEQLRPGSPNKVGVSVRGAKRPQRPPEPAARSSISVQRPTSTISTTTTTVASTTSKPAGPPPAAPKPSKIAPPKPLRPDSHRAVSPNPPDVSRDCEGWGDYVLLTLVLGGIPAAQIHSHLDERRCSSSCCCGCCRCQFTSTLQVWRVAGRRPRSHRRRDSSGGVQLHRVPAAEWPGR